MAGPLLTDLYELNMAASFLKRSMYDQATFSLFVRDFPPCRSFAVAAGLEPCISFLEDLRFDEDDQRAVLELGFDPETVQRLGQLRFTGDVWAVPEGRVVFPNEPLLEVTAPIAEAQLVETFLLNQVTFQTVIASKAARCRIASRDQVQLFEFGFRRTHGIEAGIAVARVAAMVGFAGTSNVEAARRFSLVAVGTMAHSYIEAFPREIDAFRAFAQDRPSGVVFLVDTYNCRAGVEHAIEVIRELGVEAGSGVRIDSGNLEQLSREARRMLDDAGLPDVKIFLSGGLDERDLAALISSGTPFDAAGIGTRVGVSADAPYLDTAYKLVEFAGRPLMKLSEGKMTYPAPKQVFRSGSLKDVLGLRSEEGPSGSAPLLEQVMRDGRRIGPPIPLERSRERFEADLARMPDALKALDGPRERGPALSAALEALTEQTERAAARASGP